MDKMTVCDVKCVAPTDEPTKMITNDCRPPQFYGVFFTALVFWPTNSALIISTAVFSKKALINRLCTLLLCTKQVSGVAFSS